MNKTAIYLITLISSLFICFQANAQVSTGSHVYTGTLSNIKMNNKAYDDAHNIQFTITSDNILVGTINQIGKMPGSIEINIPLYIDPTTGDIYDLGDSKCKLLILGKKAPVSIVVDELTGNVNDKTLHFKLDTHGTFGIIKIFPASVTFDGTAL